MDQKTKTGPIGLSAKEMDEDEPLGFASMTGFEIIAGLATASDWIAQALWELPAWARDNFGLMVFFSIVGIAILPEMEYHWVAMFAIPFGFSAFAAGFLALIEQADPRGDMFEDDAALWARRTFLLAFPTATLVAIAVIR
jgi:hypothetical protein